MQGSLNEHQFPDDFIPIREGDHLRVSKLQLTHDAIFANLEVSQDISGIPVMQNGALGENLFNKTLNISRVFKENCFDFTKYKLIIILLLYIQVVSGRKKFQFVSSGQNVTSFIFNGKTMDQFNTSASLYGLPEVKINYGNSCVYFK